MSRCPSASSRCTLAVVFLAAASSLAAFAGDAIPVRGRVVDAAGLPVAEARATLLPAADPIATAEAGLSGRTVEPASSAITGADGSFRVAAPHAGAWIVRLEAPGFAPKELRVAPLVEALDLPAAELSVDAGLTVRVADAAGAPVAGALVRLARPKRPGHSIGGRIEWQTPPALGFTDSAGQIVLPRADGERVSLGVSARGFAPNVLGSVRGTSASIALEPAPATPIVVVDAGGAAVPRALVATADDGLILGFTSDAGSLVASLPRGARTELSVVASGGRAAKQRVAANAGAEGPVRIVMPETWNASGRLVDVERGVGVVGGVVHDAMRPWVLATTGADGTFSLELSGASRVRLVGAARGYLPQGGHAFSRDEVRIVPPSIPLTPAAAIEGRVVDASGAPLEGARLRLEERREMTGNIEIRVGDDVGSSGEAVSGPDGHFRLAPVDPGSRWRVLADAEGFARGAAEVEGLAPYETLSGVELTLDRGRSLAGTISDQDGNAVPGARVSAKTARGRGPGMTMRFGGGGAPPAPPVLAFSGSEGTFVLEGLAPGRYDVDVSREGFADQKIAGVEIADGSEAAPEPLSIVLAPGVAVVGRVAGETGQSIAGVEVSVSRPSGGMPGMMMLPGMSASEPDAVTGPDGWFSVGGFARGDKVTVALARSGWANARRSNVELPTAAPLEIEMTPSSTLSGIVLDEAGEPVPGARINLDRRMTSEMGGASMVMQIRESSEAEDDGTFRFEDLEPGEVGLEATGFGHGTVKRTLQIPEGEDLENVELPLPAGAVVAGQVLLSDGRPATSVRVNVVSERPGMPGLSGTMTDADGRFVLEGVEPGTRSIEAMGEGRQRTVREIEAEPGVNEIELRFEGGVDVSGVVVGADGSPLAGALARLVEPGREWGGPQRRTDRDGRFTFSGVLQGEFHVHASHDAHAPGRTTAAVTVDTEDVADITVRLSSGATIAGRVTGLDSSEISRASITAFGPGMGLFESVAVDHEGTFRMENAAPGAWELRGRVGDGGRQATTQVVVPEEVGEISAELVFGQGVVLRGRVLQDERPVDGATVYVEGQDVASSGWSETDSDGRFVVEGLEEGRFQLAVRSWSTGLSHAEEVDVSDGREILIDVPTTRLTGRVVDAADGEPIAGARLALRTAGTDDGPATAGAKGTTSDLDGRFTLSPVTDGEWELSTEKPGFAVERVPVRIASGRAPSDLTVRLDATDGITLLVRLPSGRPAAEATVAVLDAAGGVLTNGTFSTGENGKLRIGSVPPGAWRVVIGAPGSGLLTVAVNAPGAPMTLDLPSATLLRVRVPALEGAASPATMRITGEDGSPFTRLQWFGTPRSEWPAGSETVIERLPPGRYQVTVTTADGETFAGSATTSTAGTAEVVLQ